MGGRTCPLPRSRCPLAARSWTSDCVQPPGAHGELESAQSGRRSPDLHIVAGVRRSRPGGTAVPRHGRTRPVQRPVVVTWRRAVRSHDPAADRAPRQELDPGAVRGHAQGVRTPRRSAPRSAREPRRWRWRSRGRRRFCCSSRPATDERGVDRPDQSRSLTIRSISASSSPACSSRVARPRDRRRAGGRRWPPDGPRRPR